MPHSWKRQKVGVSEGCKPHSAQGGCSFRESLLGRTHWETTPASGVDPMRPSDPSAVHSSTGIVPRQ